MDHWPAQDSARRHAGPGGQPRRRWRGALVTAALIASLTACSAVSSEPAEQQTPPLEEPTEQPQASETQAQTEDSADAPSSETTSSPSSDDEQSQTSDPEAIDVSEFSTEPQESTDFPEMLTEFPEDGEELLLEEVRVGKHEGYDRIVFEHIGEGAPGWHAEYVDEAVEPGSGFPLEVDGEAILYLSAVGLVPGNAGSEQGQLEVSQWSDEHGTVFEDVVTTFVHHGTASYYVGLDSERDFRISVWEHEDGPRLIIDVLH